MSITSKKSFKIVLDSTKSYTGIQFNAVYNVDLKKVLLDTEYDKQYEVKFSFRSRSGNAVTTGLNMNDMYVLALDFEKGYVSHTENMTRNIVGVLSVQNDFTSYSGTACPSFFECKEGDNGSIILPNLKSLNRIRLSVINCTSEGIFNSDNDGTINTNTRYICILTFTEI